MKNDPRPLRAGFQKLIRNSGVLAASQTPCGVPVSPARAQALMYLLALEKERKTPRHRDLQRALGIDKSNVSRLVRQMVSAGDVVESVCPLDSRARRVALAPPGRRLAKELEEKSVERFKELLDILPVGERKHVVDALEMLADVMARLDNKIGVK